MAQINWTKQALSDLEAIGDYIVRDSPAIAQVLAIAIKNCIEETFSQLTILESIDKAAIDNNDKAFKGTIW